MSTAPLLDEFDPAAPGVRWLTLDRPDRRNALNTELLDGLLVALRDARNDNQTRVIVITGSGAAFCAGADLDPAAVAAGPAAMHESRKKFAELLVAMRRCGKPIIACVNGPAVGGGVGIVANADFAVAADSAAFHTPEIKLGLFPFMIAAVMSRVMGRRAALEMIFTGEKVDAAYATRSGLINRAVPADELRTTVTALATQLAAVSPLGMKLGRDAFYAQEDMPLEGALEFLNAQLAIAAQTDDAAEGISAFLQRRTPTWTGR